MMKKALISLAVLGLALSDDINTVQTATPTGMQKFEQYFIDHPELIPDMMKTFGDVSSGQNNATDIITDGADLTKDFVGNKTIPLPAALEQAEEEMKKGTENFQQYLINHPELLPAVMKTFGDSTSQQKNTTALINDGIDIFKGLFDNKLNFKSNFKNAIQKTEHYFVNHPTLIPDMMKTFGDVLSGQNNATNIITDGADLTKDFVGNKTIPLPHALEKAEEDMREGTEKFQQYLINHPELLPAVMKTIGDSTSQDKNVSTFIGDGVGIVKGLVDNQLNFKSKVKSGIEKTGQYFVNHPTLIPHLIKTFGDVISGQNNATDIITDGASLTKDFVGNKTIPVPSAVKKTEKAMQEGTEKVEQYLINHPELLPAVIKTVGDSTSHEKNVTTLVSDGVDIVKGLVDNQLDVNSEVQKAEQYFIDHPELIPDIMKTFGDVSSGQNNATDIITDGADLTKDFVGNKTIPLPPALEKAEEAMKQGTEEFQQYLINHPELLPAVMKTFGDSTSQEKNVTALIDDGVDILKGMIEKNSQKGFLAF